MDSLVNFLDRLQPVVGARLHINAIDVSELLEFSPQICLCIGRHLPEQQLIQELAIEFMEDAAHMFGWLNTPASGDPHFDIRLAEDDELWAVHALCIELWAHNAASIRTLRLHAPALVDNRALERLRASFDLRRLHISGTNARCLIYKLSPSLYPNLSVLDISQAEMELDDIRHLESLLLEWQNKGLQLQQLIVSKHTINAIHGGASEYIVYVQLHDNYGGFNSSEFNSVSPEVADSIVYVDAGEVALPSDVHQLDMEALVETRSNRVLIRLVLR
jgi:hypothetical protein